MLKSVIRILQRFKPFDKREAVFLCFDLTFLNQSPTIHWQF